MNTSANAYDSNKIQWKSQSLKVICQRDILNELKALYREHVWVYDRFKTNKETRIFRGRHPVLLGYISDREVLVKRFMHGGLLASLFHDVFLSEKRFERHLEIESYLNQQHIPTPEIIFVTWRRCGLFYKGEMGLKYISDGMDASRYLFEENFKLPKQWEECAAQIGELVAKLHLNNMYFPDLNLMNFLYTGKGNMWLLDLDKGEICESMSRRQKAMNLSRLKRSIHKQGRFSLPDAVDSVINAVTSSYYKTYGTD